MIFLEATQFQFLQWLVGYHIKKLDEIGWPTNLFKYRRHYSPLLLSFCIGYIIRIEHTTIYTIRKLS